MGTLANLSRSPALRSAARNLDALWPDRLPRLRRPASPHIGNASVAALAVATIAGGAMAIGALAIGRLAIGRMAIGRLRVRKLEIDELIIRKAQPLESPASLPRSAGKDALPPPEEQYTKESLSAAHDGESGTTKRSTRKRNSGKPVQNEAED